MSFYSGTLKKDLAKLIPRPGVFIQQTENRSLRQYLVVVEGSFQEELTRLEEHMDTEVDWTFMGTKEQERGRLLYSLL